MSRYETVWDSDIEMELSIQNKLECQNGCKSKNSIPAQFILAPSIFQCMAMQPLPKAAVNVWWRYDESVVNVVCFALSLRLCACECLLGDSECIMQRASMSWIKKRAFSIVPNSHIVTEVSKHAWKLLHSQLFHFANSCALLIAWSHLFSHSDCFSF